MARLTLVGTGCCRAAAAVNADSWAAASCVAWVCAESSVETARAEAIVLGRFAGGSECMSTLVIGTGLGIMLVTDTEGGEGTTVDVAAAAGTAARIACDNAVDFSAVAASTLLELALLSEDAALSNAGDPPVDTAFIGLVTSGGSQVNASAVLEQLLEYVAPGSVSAADVTSIESPLRQRVQEARQHVGSPKNLGVFSPSIFQRSNRAVMD